MEELMERGVHAAVYRVFMSLDTRSLRNAACVCRSWRRYIRQYIWMSVAGRKMLRRKLDNNWRYGMPDDESIECAAKVFDIQSDAKSFIFGLENGTIEVWSKSDLTKSMTLASGDLTPLRVGVNARAIVGGFFKKKVHVWKRRTGEYAQLFSGESTMIFEIKAAEPDKVVTSLVNGVVKIYRIGEGCQMAVAHVLHTVDGAVKYIGMDGDRLATIAYKKPLTLWDMESGRIIRTVDNELGISRIHLAFPHAAALHGKSGTLRLWDLAEGRQVRSLQLDKQEYHNYHTALDGRRLAVSNEHDITVYFMDDVGDDERWESGRASVEGAGSARLHVNNTMLLESDKLVYQTAADGRVKINKFWFVKGEKRMATLAWGLSSWLWFVSVAWRWVRRTLVRVFSN